MQDDKKEVPKKKSGKDEVILLIHSILLCCVDMCQRCMFLFIVLLEVAHKKSKTCLANDYGVECSQPPLAGNRSLSS